MPLFYAETPDGYVVIGSNSGATTHPAWNLNLLANPVGQVQVGPDHYTIRARIAEGEERARLWQQMVAIYPPYAKYQEATTRKIPVVVLERV